MKLPSCKWGSAMKKNFRTKPTVRLFHKRLAVLAIFLSVPFFSQNAFAWGEYGHVTICELAYQELTKDARKELNRLLKIHKYHSSYNRACMFADDGPEKSLNPSADRQKHRSLAHYINVPRTFDYIGAEKCFIGTDCTFKAINDEMKILKDPLSKDSKKAEAMIYLGHWIGDLHQPLHVSFEDDRGGGAIKVISEECEGKWPASIHSVWDSCILNKKLYKYGWLQNWFKWAKHSKSYRLADELRNEVKDIDRTKWVSSSVMEWADESYQITISPDVKYCHINENKCQRPKEKVFIDDAYLELHAPIVRKRLKMAGIRLAHKLNLALDANYKLKE